MQIFEARLLQRCAMSENLSHDTPKNTMIKKMKESILEAMHETAKDLHKAGTMSDTTMREFDALCLPSREEIQRGTNKTDQS